GVPRARWRTRNPQVRPRRIGRDPAARSACHEAFPHQEWLRHLFHGLRLFSHRHCEGAEAHGTTPKALTQRTEDGTIKPIEAALVYFVHLEGRLGGPQVAATVAV